MKMILTTLVLGLSLSAAAELVVVAGGVSTTASSGALPAGYTSSAGTGAEGGILLQKRFGTSHFGGGVGALYRQAIYNIASGSSSEIFTQSLTVVPLYLSVYFGDHVALIGGGEYWTVSGQSWSQSGTLFASQTQTSSFNGWIGAGARPMAGIQFEFRRLVIRGAYQFATNLNNSNPIWTGTSISADIGLRFF